VNYNVRNLRECALYAQANLIPVQTSMATAERRDRDRAYSFGLYDVDQRQKSGVYVFNVRFSLPMLFGWKVDDDAGIGGRA